MRKLLFTITVACALGLIGARCSPPTAALGPAIALTLNAVSDDLNDLLVVPPSGFAVTAVFTPLGSPVDPTSFQLVAVPWGGGESLDLSAVMAVSADSAVGLLPQALALPEGSYTLVVLLSDVAGNPGAGQLSFAVREFGGLEPIGTGQQIWLDFEADRDALPGPDFAVDLQGFGLGSAAEPDLSDVARARVVAAVWSRVEAAYQDPDPNGFGLPDPVAVDFAITDPGVGDVTRICVGGAAPGQPHLIGSILIDPQNGNRNSIECGTLPATGIFPRGLLYYAFDADFAAAFDPLRPAAGGTPIGEHPLDAVVLAPGFDPGTAAPAEAARFAAIATGIQVFGDALGTIVAHETGHALGLVAPGAPGVGIHGGSGGADFAHDVTADGSAPAEIHLMNAGNAFSFASLAGLSGLALPGFRPLDFAYLRDRVVLDWRVTQLLPPPVLTAVDPAVISSGVTTLHVAGDGFAAPPSLRLLGSNWTYSLIGEAWQSDQEVTGLVVKVQVLPGIYDVELTNPDGQVARLPSAVQVLP